MSTSDPEDDICVMELIKRRKAAAASAAAAVKFVKAEKKASNEAKSKATQRKRNLRDSDEDEENSSDSDETESSDDDERPIGQLLKKRKDNNGSAKKGKDESNGKADKKIKTSSLSSLAKLSTEFYNDTDKGKLVQRLMVRWWYAITWPNPEEIGLPPAGYEALEGFPGVFICTRVRFLLTLFQYEYVIGVYRVMSWER